MTVTIIGDVHGCYETLKSLVAKIPQGDEIVFVGDLIDRGPKDMEVLRFVKEGGYKVVLGNHEDMMLNYFNKSKYYRHYDKMSWVANGGNALLDWTPELLDWVASWPMYIEFKETNATGRNLVVSHGAPLNVLNYHMEKEDQAVDLAKCADPNQHTDYLIHWQRGEPTNDPFKFFIFGHTPVNTAIVTDWYANVDTGCVYGTSKYGRKGKKLSAIRFPEMQIIEQDCLD